MDRPYLAFIPGFTSTVLSDACTTLTVTSPASGWFCRFRKSLTLFSKKVPSLVAGNPAEKVKSVLNTYKMELFKCDCVISLFRCHMKSKSMHAVHYYKLNHHCWTLLLDRDELSFTYRHACSLDITQTKKDSASQTSSYLSYKSIATKAPPEKKRLSF